MLNIAIAYINPFSTFDYTSGSSKSISVILKNLNDIGCNVFSLCSCVSYSKAGFKKSIEIDNQSNNESEIRNFIFNKSNELKNELRKLIIFLENSQHLLSFSSDIIYLIKLLKYL